MKMKILVLLSIFLMLSTQIIQAKDAVVTKTVINSLKEAGCSRAWLAHVLADNDLTMRSARHLKSGRIISLPDCQQEAPEKVKTSTLQLLADEERGIDTDPGVLLGIRTRESDDSELAAKMAAQATQLAELNKSLDAANAELKQLQSIVDNGGSNMSYLNTVNIVVMGIVLFIGIFIGIYGAPYVLLPKDMRTAPRIPEFLTIKGPHKKNIDFLIAWYQPQDHKVSIRCPHCSPKDELLKTAPELMASECAEHISKEHTELWITTEVRSA